MNRQVENVGIVREFVIQEPEEVLRRVRLIGKHCTAHASKANAALEILVRNVQRSLLQKWQSFFALTGLREADRSFRRGRDIGGRLLGRLGERQRGEGSPKHGANQDRMARNK